MYFEYMHIYSIHKHILGKNFKFTNPVNLTLFLRLFRICFFGGVLLLTKFLHSPSVKEKCKEASGRAAVCTKTVPHHLLVIKFPSSCFQERLVHAKAFVTETPDPPPHPPPK